MSKFQRTNISLKKEKAENKPNKVLEAVLTGRQHAPGVKLKTVFVCKFGGKNYLK